MRHGRVRGRAIMSEKKRRSRDTAEVAGVELHHPAFDIAALGRKQFALLQYVQRRVQQGDLDGVLSEMVRFARRREWLKIAGGNKARLLEAGPFLCDLQHI